MSYIGEVRDQCGNWSDTEKSRADSAFIAAANPAAISELIDRLEAAEEDRSNFLVEMGKLCAQCDALRLRIKAAEKAVAEAYQRGYTTGQEEIEKERDSAKKLADSLALALNTSNHERDALRAKITEIEKQEPGDVMRDAKRYRWLRNDALDWYVGPEYSTYNDVVCAGECSNFAGIGAELDATIDAKLAAAPEAKL